MYTIKIDPDSRLHERIISRIKSLHRLAERGNMKRHGKWQKAEESTLAYVPESEEDIVRRNARDNGRPQYTTIQIPYSYALLMSAHTYWTSVFFARNPVHQYSGNNGEGEMQIQALEALIAHQVDAGGMLGPYYIWLYDVGKYGCGVLGEYWDVEKIHYGQLVMDEAGQLYQTTQEVVGYTGNKVYNVAPYDFMTDPRVSMGRFQEGEFCAARKRLGWSQIVRRRDAGYFINIDKLRDRYDDSSPTSSVGSSMLERPDYSDVVLWDDVEGDSYDAKLKSHPAGATFWEYYIELIPNEWGLGKTNYPQKWCITVNKDISLIVGASPLGLIHGRFPFNVAECEIEGYGMFNRGIPEIIEPIQQTMDWLINSHFYNVRAALNNQFIIDPSRLVIKDAENVGPGFVWRLRPEGYGTDISKMFMQVPVRDVTQNHFGEINNLTGFGEKILGINDQIMGALAGGRRTATEIRTSTGFGVNRLKTITEYMSATAFTPHSQKLVQTSQQMYDRTQKMRIAGDLSLGAGQQFLEVTPELIAGMYSFIPIDGTMPIDRMAQANLWKDILGNIQRMPPQVQMGYDWGRIFAWVAPLGGLKNINQFKIQLVPDEQAALEAQRGNVVPIRGGPSPAVGPGANSATVSGINALNSPATEFDPYA